MAEIIEKINAFGEDLEMASKSAGGSGGGGMTITGGAYVPAEGGITTTNRWLRFDFEASNHKTLKILGGTTFTMGENIISFDEDTSIDFTDYISENGADYYVFVNADKRVVASTLRTQPDGYMFIGQFHTLCADCNDNMTGITSVGEVSLQVGDTITLQNYFKERDLDFCNFYTKTIDAINNGSYYNVATIIHPLSGFKAMDILPESVWCLNWHPVSKSWDGMVWCNECNCCVDIYLQSGTGENTRSEYGAVHTVNRQLQNHIADFISVGRKIIKNYEQFTSISNGSNERSFIQGAMDHSTVGGHVDTAGRRMISFIGCEECSGYLFQFFNVLSEHYSSSSTAIDDVTDGRGLFGHTFDRVGFQTGGASYGQSQSATASGTRSISFGDNINYVQPILGARGCCDITVI